LIAFWARRSRTPKGRIYKTVLHNQNAFIVHLTPNAGIGNTADDCGFTDEEQIRFCHGLNCLS
jgi:hypothetical protein